jgi:hypothetical protein
MNIYLEKLFDKYNVSQCDRYEINQIYSLLTPQKQHNLINNFELLIIRLNKIQEDLEIERRILIPEAIDDIKNILDRVKRERIEKESRKEINLLKQNV